MTKIFLAIVMVLFSAYGEGQAASSRVTQAFKNYLNSMDKKNFESALSYAEAALDYALEDKNTPIGEITILKHNLAGLYHYLRKYDRAEKLYLDALSNFQLNAMSDFQNYMKIIDDINTFFRQTRQWSKLTDMLEQQVDKLANAIEISRIQSDEEQFAKYGALVQIFGKLHSVYGEIGNLNQAVAVAKRSTDLVTTVRGSTAPQTLTQQNNVGWSLLQNGKLGEAEQIFRDVISIYRSGAVNNDVELGTTLHNLSLTLMMQNRPQQALPLVQEAINLREGALGPDSLVVAESLNLEGNIYFILHEYKSARKDFERSMDIYKRTDNENSNGAVLDLMALGNIESKENRRDKQKDLYAQARDISVKIYGSDSWNVTMIDNILAGEDIEDGKFAEAEARLVSNLSRIQSKIAANHFTAVQAQSALARTLVRANKFDEAYTVARRLQKTLNDGLDFGEGGWSASALQQTKSLKSIYHDVIEVYLSKRTLSEEDKEETLRLMQLANKSTVGEAALKLGLRNKRLDTNASELVRSYQNTIEEIRALDKQALVVMEDDSKSQLLAEVNILLGKKKQMLTEKARELRKIIPEYLFNYEHSTVSLQDIRNKITDHEAIIAISIGHWSSFRWVITASQISVTKIDLLKDDADRLVSDIRATLVDSAQAFALVSASRLYDVIIRPIEDELRDIKSLIFVLDNTLQDIPMGLLSKDQVIGVRKIENIDLSTINWLQRDFSITLWPGLETISSLSNEPSSNIKPSLLGFGAPDLPKSETCSVSLEDKLADLLRLRGPSDINHIDLCPLPEAKRELIGLSHIVGEESSDIFVDKEASKSKLNELGNNDKLKNYSIIAFATHALLATESSTLASIKEPGLVLSLDANNKISLLTSSDIIAYNLNAKLVLLSACNTSAGDADGETLAGLARAFIYAGSRSVLVSHWYVSSSATELLILQTMKYALDDKKRSLTSAYRAAALDMIAGKLGDNRYVHPRYWAAFSLVGDASTRLH